MQTSRSVARFVIPLAVALFLAAGPAPVRKTRVTMEIVTVDHVPITASQQWYTVMKDLGIVGLRIRSAGGNEKAEIEQIGTKIDPAYRVTGILTEDNVLVVPGGKFTVRDTAKLRKWLDTLGDQGEQGVTQPKVAFGLVLSQWEKFHEDLKKPVVIPTKDTALAQAVSKIGRRLEFPLVLDPAAERAMAEEKVEDELQGFSSGTALAMMLRPAGLAFEPERQPGGKMQYRVRKAQASRAAWPIGWKPTQPLQKVVPQSFDFLNVELKEISVSEVLEAIEGRLKTPFFFDHTSLAAEKIDPAKVEINLPAKRLSYAVILQKVLIKARLKYDLRLDEADKPFFWVTSLRPAP